MFVIDKSIFFSIKKIKEYIPYICIVKLTMISLTSKI